MLAGLGIALLFFPLCRPTTRRHLRQRWSAALLDGLAVRLVAQGVAPEPGTLLVANHISWLDIFAINALTPSAFISKAEVRQWPLIGWLAARNDTVFLRRGSRGHARIINAEIAHLLGARNNVALFPEGTTTDGSHLLHFHAALLQPAIAADHRIQPVALRYETATGERTAAAAYVGDMSLGQCVRNILAAREIVLRITVMPSLETNGRDRRELARIAHEQIAASIAA